MATATAPMHGSKGARWILAALLVLLAGCGDDAEDGAKERHGPPAVRSTSAFQFARHPEAAALANPLIPSHDRRAEQGLTFGSVTLGNISRFGMSMPTASAATWEVDVPSQAVVELAATFLPTMPPPVGANEAAVVFEAAHAPAPWTLPSARAVLSGRQPESWYEEANLPERMAEAGFLTLAAVSNPYLAASFDMHRGWSEHTMQNKRPADALVDAAIASIEAHADRDLLLMVHFMDTHLPYREPSPYRGLWAETEREEAEEFARDDLRKLDPSSREFPRRRRETIDRYDQTIRFVDVELARLLTALGPDATVAFFSDHGEEFWDHGGVEHGHDFHEELLRVPLILRDPHLPPGRCEVPVTLLDVAPSVLELAGLESGRSVGRSLLDATYGNAAALAGLEERPRAFGRPLYGGDGWGVMHRGKKWYSRVGGQFLYDLRRDPGETSNLASGGRVDLSPYPAALGEALGREVRLVWRVVLLSPASNEDVVFTLRHPSGIERAWPTYDPNERGEWSAPEAVDGALRIVQSAGKSMPRAVYVLPAGDPLDPRGLRVSLSGGGSDVTAVYSGAKLRSGGGAGTTVFQGGDDRRRFAVFFAYVPLSSGVEVPGFDPDVAEELRELGYVE